ncbi:MAG: pilus assembly protein PilM [Syntrophomonadaceae bacterium]|nr:pilus assembly protein PilM [Syntrophomonadaceae bacterium]
MDSIFALDIGTRKVVGLVLQKRENEYVVLDSEMLEHKTRAMIDGQIHDVEAVANTIKQIKLALEKRLNTKLESGAVAAAGRALKTSKGRIAKKRATGDEITREEVLALEIEAVQIAQYNLVEEEGNSQDNSHYFCVGYSVVDYYLNDQKISNLVGQIGTNLEVEVIATFLPRVVVDSLFSSLKRADLEVSSLTLEPIAALSVAIPPNMRLLNLALVDIGAGTSDIAIVKDGTISGYGMVPMGGDKLTELIAAQYLLDFDTAEILKRNLGQSEVIEFTDILGNKNRVESKQIIEEMKAITNDLVYQIAESILELNQKHPDAVVLVGGGSMTPNLANTLAEYLNIPLSRVGLRSPSSLNELIINSDFLRGPQGVTPLGIAYNCFVSKPMPFIKVKVNSREVILLNAGKITVSQALLSSGISLSNIYGKPGLGKTIEINGVVKSFKGQIGKPPVIKVNNVDSSLDTVIEDGDVIEFVRGEDGKDAVVKVGDLIPNIKTGFVYVNDEILDLEPMVMVNGSLANYDEEVPDRAKVEYKQADTVRNILTLSGVPDDYLKERTYKYYLNGELLELKWRPITVTLNDEIAYINEPVQPDDRVYYTYKNLKPKIKDALGNHNLINMMVEVNGEKIALEITEAEVKSNGQPISLDEEITEGINLELDKDKASAILSDIFRVYKLESASKGRLKMVVDGKEAGFTTPIFNGSKIELIWVDD